MSDQPTASGADLARQALAAARAAAKTAPPPGAKKTRRTMRTTRGTHADPQGLGHILEKLTGEQGWEGGLGGGSLIDQWPTMRSGMPARTPAPEEERPYLLPPGRPPPQPADHRRTTASSGRGPGEQLLRDRGLHAPGEEGRDPCPPDHRLTGGNTSRIVGQPDRDQPARTEPPMPQPTCCPDAYLCPASGDMECPRHSGFTICCDRPDAHVLQDRDVWHRQQEADERAWLDQWARAEKTPERPWTRPNWDVLGDMRAHMDRLTASAGRP